MPAPGGSWARGRRRVVDVRAADAAARAADASRAAERRALRFQLLERAFRTFEQLIDC